MKRYVCTVVTGLLLALVSTGTATASILPPLSLPGDSGKQETNLLPGPPGKEEEESGQSVEQENDADVDNKQTNKNILSPPIAIAVLGDAEASNEQSNKAETDIEQENEAKQQDSYSGSGGGNGCCNGQSQAGEQDVEQENDADVDNKQTNANVLSPPIAIAVLGDAEASNEQSNKAETDIEQENEAKQQDSYSGSGGGNGCCNGQSQAGEQDVEQENDADVDNKQTNANVLSPPVALGILGKAEAENEQTNVSKIDIEQENEAKQESEQKSYGSKPCSSSCQPKKDYGRKPECSLKCEPQREYGRESSSGGQSVKQENDADVDNKQTNANVLSPPVALGILGKAEAENEQTNVSKIDIEQENEAKQESEQKSYGSKPCSSSCQPKKDYGRKPECSLKCEPQREYGRESSSGGQSVKQENDADVDNKQTNANVLSPPVALGILGKAEAENEQTNVSKIDIEQENEAKQESEQKSYGSKPCSSSCQPKKDYGRKPECSLKCEPQREYGRESSSGGQSVKQENDADVDNKQTNANVLSPPVALGILGKAEAENEQTNVSKIDIEQENEAKQESEQKSYGSKPCSSSCQPKKDYGRKPECSLKCEPQREYGRESSSGGQSVKQENDADVDNKQTNANVLSPPVALGILGKAEAENEQTNVSKIDIEQENEAKQESEQKSYGSKPCSSSCQPKKDYGRKPECSLKCEPQREYGRESSSGGQSVKQENDADVDNKQTNANVLSPPVALGILGKAEAENEQTNVSKIDIEQENEAYQHRNVVDMCKGLIYR